MSAEDVATRSQILPRNIVSVVIPACNAATGIGALLRSLLPDIGLIHEILLIDDGSEDATAEIAQDIAQRHHLPLLIFSVSCGSAGAARNIGITHARGQFLFFVDGDDELVPGALTLLTAQLIENPHAGLVIGACIRQTAGRPDKIKSPQGYTDDCRQNVTRYLANELWPIAMGSALVVTAVATDIRFPEVIGLDEDTCYWATLLTRARVVTVPDPVLIYKLDEARMARRFTHSPRKTLLNVARTFRALSTFNIPAFALKQRVAWIALRMARQLILDRRYAEAHSILRLVRRHPMYRASWHIFRYDCRIKFGRLAQRFGKCAPSGVPVKINDLKNERHILLVTLDDASTPVSGADLRNNQNARFARDLGLVKVVSIRPRAPDIAASEPGLEFCSVGVPGEKTRSLSSWRCSLEARIPRSCLLRLLAIIHDFKPDTIIVEGIPLTALLKHLRPFAKLLILDMHNVESSLAATRPPRTSKLSRFIRILKNDHARIRRLEKQAIQAVDRIWVCSTPDRDRLIELHQPAKPIYTVPNTIPRFDELNQQSTLPSNKGAKGPVLLFVGHLGYWPNVTAVERLVGEIFPKVKIAFPSAQLILAGRHPNPAVKSIATAQPGVELHANPESLSEFYDRAHMAVVPLSAGGGTRIKILEAMTSKLPVVATHIAVEGLGLVENEEVLLADSDEGLARHIIDLWANPEKISRQTLYAEKTVKALYHPRSVNLAAKTATSWL